MPSPFLGMNPYLEQPDVWHDFHEALILEIRAAVASQVRPQYIVKLDEHVYVHELSAEERIFLERPDVSVAKPEGGTPLRATSAVIDAPSYATLPPAVDMERMSYVELRDRESRELITVIELLSPTNKNSGPDREQHVAKRKQILQSPVHLVEIDLLRGGPRMPLEDLTDCDYYALVSRAEMRPRVGVWPLRLREPLPTMPIPLRSPDPDARLDLQAALHRVYDAAGYEDYIYTGRPHPPLHPQDAEWARSIVQPADS